MFTVLGTNKIHLPIHTQVTSCRTVFQKNIAPFVNSELELAAQARETGNIIAELQYLENAHAIGQESIYWDVKVHVLMFLWAVRNAQLKELFGQSFRIEGAAKKTAFDLVPQGNAGGVNVSPINVMRLKLNTKQLLILQRLANNLL